MILSKYEFRVFVYGWADTYEMNLSNPAQYKINNSMINITYEQSHLTIFGRYSPSDDCLTAFGRGAGRRSV